MKPVLFPSTATTYTTQGIGALDCASCTVTEERNGIFELQMRISVNATHYEDCVEGNIIVAIHDDTKTRQPFQIYKRSKPINGIVTVNAEHISYRLAKLVVTPFSASSITTAFSLLKSRSVETCPFTFWTDKASQGSFNLEQPASMRSVLGGEQGSFLDVFGGGEYKWDNFTVRLYQHRGIDSGVTLRKGKNITDYTKETNASGVYTGIVPFYMDNGTAMLLPEKVIRLSGAPAGYTVAVDLSDKFEEKPTVAQLRAAANTYLNANAKASASVNGKVSFVALWQTEEYKKIAPLQRVNLCDTVTVVFDEGDEIKTKVIKTVYNVLLERYDEIELGESVTNMSTAIKSITDSMTGEDVTKTEMQKALEHAAELITGGLGGYVVFKRNANGEPEEILIMDTPDKDTAVNVIRMNRNGIAFSQRGYNGPFNTAWTIDSRFVADFITAGTLTANIIKAGILGDKANRNYWNMVTGEFSLSAGAKVGGNNIANTKYVDDTAKEKADNAVSVFDKALNQEKVFNKLTNNGQTQGIYLSNNRLYINANYIKSGTISADLIKSGVISSKTGNLVINLDNGTIEGPITMKAVNGNGGSCYVSGDSLNVRSSSGYIVSLNPDTSSFRNVTIMGSLNVFGGGGGSSQVTINNPTKFNNSVMNSAGAQQFYSDRRKKNTIADLLFDKARDFIMSLRPRSFKFNNGTSGRLHHGFIAQEVFDAMDGDDWGVYTEIVDEGEKVCCIRPDEIIADLVAVVQTQQKKIDELEDRIIALEGRT